MTINSRTLLLAKRQRKGFSPRRYLRSGKFNDFITYTLLRSKGFAVRKISGFLTESIETGCLALIASHASFKLGFAIAMANLIVGTLTQGLFLSLRADLFALRKISTRLLQILLPALALIIHASALSMVVIKSPVNEPILIFLVFSRIFASLVQISLETHTAEYNMQRRVYLSPWVSYGGVFFVCIAGVFALAAPSIVTLAILVSSSSLVKIITSFIFYRQTKLAMIDRPLPPQGTTQSVSNFKPTLRRMMVILLAAAMSIIPVFYIQSNILEAFALIIVVKNLVKIAAERPFRAVQVEIVNAAQFKQWDFIANVVARASKVSFIMIGLFGVVGLGVALTAADAFISVCVVWAILFIINGALTLRLMTVGLDDEISTHLITARAAIAIAPLAELYFIGQFTNEHIIGMMLIGELFIAAFLFRQYTAVNLAQRLEFKVETDYMAANIDSQPSVLNFLNCFRIISPYLASAKVSQDLLLIKVRHAIRAPQKAREFISELSSTLRGADLVIALDSTHFILWAPASSSHSAIKTRIFKKWPLEIHSISQLDLASFLSIINATRSSSFKDLADDIMRHPHSFLAALELSLSSRVPLSTDGHWWTQNDSGTWQCLSIDATPAQNEMFQKIATQSRQDIFLTPGKNKTFHGGGQKHWTLSPFGKVLAIYSSEKLNTHTLDGLRAIHNEMIADKIHADSKDKSVHAAEFYMLYRILGELSKRLPIMPIISGKTEMVEIPGQRLIASTRDGGSKMRYLLAIENSSQNNKAS